MVGRIRLLPYKQGSKSAKALATALGGKVLKLEGGKFKPKADDLIINWGNSSSFWPTNLLQGEPCEFLNYGETIKNVSNKLKFFNLMKENNHEIIPEFWTDAGDIPDNAFPVVCRTILSGHSGAGIIIANTRDELVSCSLYTRYLKKKDEYRVHVGRGGAVIAVQRKARNTSVENPNWMVRNHANGFVFVRNEVNPPVLALDVAHRALSATGLDFGAVDVIWNEQQGKAYVLEVNTAPGLEGQTVLDYAEYFRSQQTV